MVCRYIVRCLLAFIIPISVRADYFDQKGILRENGGSLKLLTYSDAKSACPLGTHIPSAREFGKISVVYGAAGLLEKDQVSGDIPLGYDAVSVVNEDGKVDEFYFNVKGYSPDSSFTKDQLPTFWTSSIIPLNEIGGGWKKVFTSQEGSISWAMHPRNRLGVWCQ